MSYQTVLEAERDQLRARAEAAEAKLAHLEAKWVERLLSDEAVHAAALKADEPYEWSRESPQEFIKRVLEAALEAIKDDER